MKQRKSLLYRLQKKMLNFMSQYIEHQKPHSDLVSKKNVVRYGDFPEIVGTIPYTHSNEVGTYNTQAQPVRCFVVLGQWSVTAAAPAPILSTDASLVLLTYERKTQMNTICYIPEE